MVKRRSPTATAKPQRVAKRPPARPANNRATKMQALIHELQVHAEEITVQNEQLRKAQHELEEVRDRFADLYDFAPIGYLSVNARGDISEINLAGATLLGRARSLLVKFPLTQAVAKAHRQLVDDFLVRARARARGAEPQTTEVSARTDGHRLLQLLARPGLIGPAGDVFIVMVDVTEERRLEHDRREALNRERALAAERALEIAERTVAQARVKALLERLVTAQEEERRRIARNLHDHLGQQLTALRLTLDAIGTDAAMPKPLRQRIETVQRIVSKMDRDIDRLAWDLRPATLDDVGLTAALAEMVRQWTTSSEVPAEFHETAHAGVRLPPEAESNVYRIVQEALNNVAKHAGATHVSVLLEQRDDEMGVIIEDNGRGFNPDAVLASRDRQEMMGLLGMHERAALIDANVQIESAPGKGTTVFVRIPVKKP